MKSFTQDEFISYVKNLNFEELEDVASFVQEYYNHFRSIPESNKKEKDDAWEKCMILQAKFGEMFVAFTLSVISLRKLLNEELESEKDRSEGSLEV